MMFLLIGLGTALIVTTMVDFAVTALTVAGGGPITMRLVSALWFVLLRVHRERPIHRILSWVGPSVLLLVLVVWSLLLWIAWTLIFAAGHPAFIKSQSGEAVSDAWSLVLYTGLSLVTGSLGDAAPNGPVWQLVSLICAFNGLFLVTAGVTYLLPIVAAVSDKRRLGIVLASLGTSGEAILSRAWTGRDFDGLREHLIALTPEVALIAQRQLAYPVCTAFTPASA